MLRNVSRYRVLILCAIKNIVDVEVEGRVGATEKHHDVRHNEGEVVVAASEVELWLHERSDLNHDGPGQANYEQNRRHHQRRSSRIHTLMTWNSDATGRRGVV